MTAATRVVRQAYAGCHGRRQGQHGGVGGDDGAHRPGRGHEPGGAAAGVAGVGVHDWVAAQGQRAVAADHQV